MIKRKKALAYASAFLAEKERFEFAKAHTSKINLIQFCQPQSHFFNMDIYGKYN